MSNNNIRLMFDRVSCCGEDNPIGVDKPDFSFTVSASSTPCYYEYRIIVSSEREKCEKGIGDMWDSGLCRKDTYNIAYRGKPMTAFSMYWWRISLFTGGSEAAVESSVMAFVTGPVCRSSWKAETFRPSDNRVMRLRKRFVLNKKPAYAYLFLAASGEKSNGVVCRINGKRVGTDYLFPGVSEYFTMYQSGYDISSYIGETNVVNLDFVSSVSAILKFFYTDGTSETVSSDYTWEQTDVIPYRLGYDRKRLHGKVEEFDANQRFDAWYTCADAEFHAPAKPDIPWGPLFIRYRAVKTILREKTTAISAKPFCGGWLFDFGKIHCGFASVILHGEKSPITIRYAERISDKPETASLDMLWPPYCKYTPRGEQEEKYIPDFMHTSFRYILVEGLASAPSASDYEAYNITSDIYPNAAFSCSDSDINRLFDCGMRSFAENMVNIPTDCPGRERRGWTADSYAVIDSELMLFNCDRFYRRWFEDFKDCQRQCGWVTVEFPDMTDEHIDLNWPLGMIFDLWEMYLHNGDIAFLRSFCRTAEDYLNLVLSLCDSEYSFADSLFSYGDWTALEPATPSFICAAMVKRCADIMSDIFGVLKDAEKSESYRKISADVNEKLNKTYFHTTADGCYYDNNTQSANTLAAAYGLCEGEKKAAVVRSIASDIEKKGTMTCGFIGCNLLFSLLADNGCGNLAYKLMVTENNIPGNLLAYIKSHDLATFPECTYTETSSNNHAFFAGGYLKWIWSSLCGVRYANAGGSKIEIKPFFAEGIEYANLTTETPNGKLVSNWKKENGKISFEITVPHNCEAALTVADKPEKRFVLQSGHHTLSV